MSAPPGSSSVTQRSEIIQRFSIPEHRLNSGHDYSYGQNDGRAYSRGGRAYNPPFGWDKLGILLSDASFMDVTNGWHVGYHGTDPINVQAIIEQGLKVQGGQLHAPHGSSYGVGIYCSPLPDVAKNYAGEKRVAGAETDVLLMVRVRPGGYREPAANIWVVSNPSDIICTNILFRRK